MFVCVCLGVFNCQGTMLYKYIKYLYFDLWCCFIYNIIIIYFVWKINPFFIIFIIFFCDIIVLFYLLSYLYYIPLHFKNQPLFTKNPNFFFSKIVTLSVMSRSAVLVLAHLALLALARLSFLHKLIAAYSLLRSTGLSHTVPLSSCLIGGSISQHASYAGDWPRSLP